MAALLCGFCNVSSTLHFLMTLKLRVRAYPTNYYHLIPIRNITFECSMVWYLAMAVVALICCQLPRIMNYVDLLLLLFHKVAPPLGLVFASNTKTTTNITF